MHTPGHTVDHICLHDPQEGILLSGDHEKVRQWRLQQSRLRAEKFDSGAE